MRATSSGSAARGLWLWPGLLLLRFGHAARGLWLWPGLLLLSTCVSAEPAAWRISSPQPGGELVLLGSVHVLREEDHPLPERLDVLYRQADTLVLELGPRDLEPMRVQSVFVSAALLPPGTTLGQILDADLYERLSRHAREFGLEPALIERFKPWMAAVTLLDAGQARHGFRADLGVEQQLLERAAADGMEVTGLESLATQVAVFDRLSMDDQQALLEQTLRELDTVGESMDTLVNAWRNGDLDELAEELLDEFREFPELYEALITERHAAWIEVLESLLADGRRHLVVVGALHLLGPDSVIESMEERGWETTLLP